MNRYIALLILLLIVSLGDINAQFDERFYFPSKKGSFPDSLNVKEIPLCVESDTIYLQCIPPTTTALNKTILYFHGAGGNSSRYISLIQPLLNHGYDVCMVDLRGYGRSSGKPTHINIAHDAQVVLDTLVQLTSNPIICYGASMGSQIATRLTADNQDIIDALILDCPLSSFTDIAVHSSPEASKGMVAQFVTSPYAAKEDVKRIEELPILIIHGDIDASIPLVQGQLVYDNAISPNKQLWIYKGDHLEAPTKYTKTFLEYCAGLF